MGTHQDAIRQVIIAEAETWLNTPFHHEARLKGVGVDCGQLLKAVYLAAGLVDEVQEQPYAMQWHLHRSEEVYLAWIEKFGRLIPGPPGPGDVAIWKMGRTHSHAAIVVAWPKIIHASLLLGKCCRDDATTSPMHLEKYPVRFYTYWGPNP